jgi:hypothetical protein
MSTMPALAAMRSAAAPSPRVPTFATVVRNQIRMIDVSRRAILLLTVMVGGVIIFLNPDVNEGRIDIRSISMLPLLFAGMVWPLFIWQGETRTRRTYHRWLPVGQVAHDFAKIIAGAIYLLGAATIVATLVNLVALYRLGPHYQTTIPGVIAMVVGSLVIYLWSSLLPILSDKPLHWFVGFWPAMIALGFLADSYAPFIGDVLEVLFNADFGLALVLGGGDLLTNNLMSNPVILLYWSAAVLLWTIIALGCLYLASVWANRKSEP